MMVVRKVMKVAPRFKEYRSYVLLLLIIAVILPCAFFLQEEDTGTQLLEDHIKIPYKNKKNNNENPEDHIERRRTQSTISDLELATCVEALQDFSVDGKVNQEQFVLFVENFFPENNRMTFHSFVDLPFPFILIFFTTACGSASNNDCVNEEAAIPVANVMSSSIGLLVSLCSDIKDLSAVQVEFPFQYRLKYYQHHDGDDNVEAQNLLSENGINGINGMDLENAFENVLLKTLSCSGNGDGRNLLRESSVKSYNQGNGVKSSTKQNTIDNILQHLKNSSTPLKNGRLIRKLERHSTDGTSLCDYTVHAEVVDASSFECQPLYNERKVRSDWNCVLVTSKVIVTAASILSLPTTTGFRSEIASILRDAVNKNNILSFF